MGCLKSFLAYISIFALLLFAISSYEADNSVVILTFTAIILICTYQLFSQKNVIYGLSQIFYIFCLFFLGIAPLFQYLSDITLWGGEPFNDSDYIKTNILILMALVIYKYIYANTFRHKYNIRIHMSLSNSENNVRHTSNILIVVISLISSIYIYIIFGGNIASLLLRGEYADSDVVAAGGLAYLINSFFIRPVPAICFLLFKFYNNKNKLIEIFLFILMILTNAPTGMPRFAVAAFYVPLAFLYIKSLRKRHNFVLMMVLAVVVIFPFLNTFRTVAEGQLISFDMFLAGHFDSYQMFMRVVSTQYITYGYQLLGVLLFFVPRSLWASKPIGSGYLIAHENDYYFDNLSMNFFGEGYINFGIIGVCLFAMFIGYINARLDRKYWVESGNSIPLFSLIFFETIGMEFAIMRGALLNIFPVLLGYILATKIIHKIVSRP